MDKAENMNMKNAVVVTGTDTGVGKSIVAASLARALLLRGIKVGVVKPFASGIDIVSDSPDNDAALLKLAAESELPITDICPAVFDFPLAPLCSARLEGRRTDIEEIRRDVLQLVSRHEFTIIEGVGGAAVPVADGVLFSDFAAQLGCPALLVARTALGTINHSILSVQHMRAVGVEVVGIVFVRHRPGALTLDEEVGPATACEFTGCRNLGTLPHIPGVINAKNIGELSAALPVEDSVIQGLASLLTSSLSGSVDHSVG